MFSTINNIKVIPRITAAIFSCLCLPLGPFINATPATETPDYAVDELQVVVDQTFASPKMLAPVYSIDKVQTIIDQGAKNVAINIVKTLALYLREQKSSGKNITLKAFAAANINSNLDQDLAKADPKIKILYNELMQSTQSFINAHSKDVLVPMLQKLNTETGEPNSSRMLIGSFALSETKRVLETLRQEQPGVLEDSSAWR